MNRSLCLLILFSGFFQTGYCQKITIHKSKEYRPLTWRDFDGKVKKESPFHAETFWEISYKMATARFSGDTAITDAEIELSLGEKSWVKKDKQTDYLLKHEQGHFDIAVICAREMMLIFKNTTFYKKDYRAKSYAVYFDIMKKYRELEKQYDNETRHSMDEAQQQKWDEYISRELKKVNAP